MKTIGKKDWAFSAGCIPFKTTGKEPLFTSHDKISVLNTSKEKATITLFIFYEDAPPDGPYEINIQAQRVRKIRFNDLIDPKPIALQKKYSCAIHSDIPVIIQFSSLNTGSKANAEMGTIAFAG